MHGNELTEIYSVEVRRVSSNSQGMKQEMCDKAASSPLTLSHLADDSRVRPFWLFYVLKAGKNKTVLDSLEKEPSA